MNWNRQLPFWSFKPKVLCSMFEEKEIFHEHCHNMNWAFKKGNNVFEQSKHMSNTRNGQPSYPIHHDRMYKFLPSGVTEQQMKEIGLVILNEWTSPIGRKAYYHPYKDGDSALCKAVDPTNGPIWGILEELKKENPVIE